MQLSKKVSRKRESLRGSVKGTQKRPRLSVFRSNQHIYAQVIDWSGNTTFFDGGVPISEADNDQGSISFDINQSRTHSLITWEDYRNGSDFEIFANVFDLQNGTIMGDEIQFSNDTTDQFKPIVKNIEDNEFFVVWEDGRGYYNEDPLLINGVLYEPNNLNEWQNFLLYIDTQDVYIDYQFTNEISICSGLEKIDIYCLTNP